MKPVIRLFSNFDYPRQDLEKLLPGGTLTNPHFDLRLNESGSADLVIVLGFAPIGSWVTTPKSRIIKLVQDPIQPGLFGRYTRVHSRVFSQVLSPFEDTKNVRKIPTILDWHIPKSRDQLLEEMPPLSRLDKKKGISAIASTKTSLPGHRRRDKFISDLIGSSLDVDVFGRGRPNQLENKLEGLADYRYSIAIENTSHADYWTEKISDCFLAWTMPIYFGCTNISDYFNPRSMKLIDLSDTIRTLDEISSLLEQDPFFGSIEALQESRLKVLMEYSLYPFLVRQIEEINSYSEKQVTVRLETLDTYAHKFRDIVARVVRR